MSQTVRPTKKQRDLLNYIEMFIGEHGYSPSYREIMNGLGYGSVATVALHVNSLIGRGHLRKRDHSARSLEVVAVTESAATSDGKPATTTTPAPAGQATSPEPKPADESWLIDKVEKLFQACERPEASSIGAAEDLAVIVNALRLLGLTEAAAGFEARLSTLVSIAAAKARS